MDPSLGRIVQYALNDADVAAIRKRRRAVNGMANGNPINAGEIVALIVTTVWPGQPGVINGQAILDGDDSYWVTMAAEGPGPGRWTWPPRAESIDLTVRA